MNENQLTLEFAKQSDIPNPLGPRADLPLIELPSGGLTITESAAALFKLIAPSQKLFVRDGMVMKLGPGENGVPVLSVLEPAEARSDFEKFGQLVVQVRTKTGETVLKQALCSEPNAKALLHSAEAKKMLPQVSGLINCPIIRESDGQIAVAGPGYDAVSKRLVTGGKMPEEVDLDTARNALLGLVEEFEFESDADKSRAIASILSPALKLGGFLKGRVPADMAEANESQAGKGYRQKIIAKIYNELLSPITKRAGGVGSLDEFFSQKLLEGRPFIQLDNLRGRIDSQQLEAFFTADGVFSCRIPYHPIVNVQAADYFIFLTSNGLDTTRDLANRSAIIRIRKRPEGHRFRQYDEGDLLAHVSARQSYYLGCVFSVIRAWHQAGKPSSNETRHDFKEWVGILDWIVQNIFKLAPLMDGHLNAQKLISNPDIVFLRQVCIVMGRVEGLGEPQTASEIASICASEHIAIPGLQDAGDTQRCAQQVGSCLGRTFNDGSNTVQVDAYQVAREIRRKKRDDGQGYIDTKTYTFTKIGDVQTSPPKRTSQDDLTKSEPANAAMPNGPDEEYPRVTYEPGKTIASFVGGPPGLRNKFQKPNSSTTTEPGTDSGKSGGHSACPTGQSLVIRPKKSAVL